MDASSSSSFYAETSPLTEPGRHAEQLARLPVDVGALARVIQGLLIYDVVATDFYAVRLAEVRQQDIHLRSVRAMLDAILAIDARNLAEPRPPAHRLASRCDHYTRLLTAMLRVKGVPARARCGFATYFNPGHLEDHWVCEAWNARAARWTLIDAQLDAVWRDKLRLDFDPLDVPRTKFIVAGEVWQQCRAGALDPATCGISFAQLFGLWYVAGSVLRDIAGLNKVEVLPWDVWGDMPRQGQRLSAAQLAAFDDLCSLTVEPDAHFGEIRARFENDAGLRVPAQVFNALRMRAEAL